MHAIALGILTRFQRLRFGAVTHIATLVAPSVLASVSVTFFFLLGFPFGNHNESLAWQVQLEQTDFVEVLTVKFFPVATHRPLGQVLAWFAFYLTGGSL